MDLGHIVQALSMPLFKGHFLGFMFADTLLLTKKGHKHLDFYVVNTNHIFGEHWYCCTCRKTKCIGPAT